MRYTNNQQVCLLMRLFLGVMFLSAALMKLHTGIPTFVEGLVKGFQHTMLPVALVEGYGYVLPVVELVLGITLLLGMFTEAMLAVSSVTLLSLFFGMWASAKADVACYNAVYLLINLCAIRWFEHTVPSVDVITRKKAITAPSS